MATAGSHGLSYKGAGKPAGLLCSSHTLEHRYHDEQAPGEKRQWRKLAKRREERIWKREVQEEMDDDQG